MLFLKKNIVTTVLMLLPIISSAQFLNTNLKKNEDEELYTQALEETNKKDYAKAINLAGKAVDQSPRNTDYNLLLGRLYVITKQYSMARPYILKVLDRSPKYRDAYFYAISIETADNHIPLALHYADEALDRFPGDLEFSIKKLSLLDAYRKFPPGDTLAEELLSHYPDMPEVTKTATEHYRQAGVYYKAKGFPLQAKMYFDQVLRLSPENSDASGALFALNMQSGDYQSALQQVSAALNKQPGSYDLLMKKVSLLQQMHQYYDAIAVLKVLKSRYPADAKVKNLDVSLRLEASRYYEQTDPYVLYQTVLAANPSNKEALNKLIGISMDRGVYLNALDWINKGLRSSPQDVILLSKKADVLEMLDNKAAAAAIVLSLWKRNPTSKPLRTRAAELQIAVGKAYLNDKAYDKAVPAFEEALAIEPNNVDAENYLANVYIEQKDYESALAVIDMALRHHKDDEQMLLKKAGVLADAGRYSESFPIISKLMQQHPANAKYNSMLAEQQLLVGRQLMNSEETEQAIQQFKDVLAQDPGNRDALSYVINMEAGVGRPETALIYADKALEQYPNDKDFLLKKASVLNDLNEYDKAAGITLTLMDKYPYNKSYRAAYVDNLLASGSAHQKEGNMDAALTDYKAVLAVAPHDTLALFAIINIDNTNKEYDTALALIDKGLMHYSGNLHLMQQRINTLEYKGMYAEAAEENARLEVLSPSALHTDHGNYLRGKLLHDQFGLYYLQSIYYGKATQSFRIGVVEYRHFFDKGSYAVRVNYGIKNVRAGMQYEGDLYYTHSKKEYSYLYASYSDADLIFPQLRLGYSLFSQLGRGYEIETGLMYVAVRSTDSVSAISSTIGPGIFTEQAYVYSGVIGLAKTVKDFWFNVHAYLIYDYPKSTMSITDNAGLTSRIPTLDKPHFYQVYQGTVRYYMNNHKEFMALTVGTGTSPDDRTRVMLLPQLTGNFLNKYVNIGYQKTFNYRTTVGASAGLSNYQVNANAYQNQFDLYLFLTRKF